MALCCGVGGRGVCHSVPQWVCHHQSPPTAHQLSTVSPSRRMCPPSTPLWSPIGSGNGIRGGSRRRRSGCESESLLLMEERLIESTFRRKKSSHGGASVTPTEGSADQAACDGGRSTTQNPLRRERNAMMRADTEAKALMSPLVSLIRLIPLYSSRALLVGTLQGDVVVLVSMSCCFVRYSSTVSSVQRCILGRTRPWPNS